MYVYVSSIDVHYIYIYLSLSLISKCIIYIMYAHTHICKVRLGDRSSRGAGGLVAEDASFEQLGQPQELQASSADSGILGAMCLPLKHTFLKMYTFIILRICIYIHGTPHAPTFSWFGP